MMKKTLLTMLLLGACAQAQAAEVAGVKLEDSVHLSSRDLQFNGAGVRNRFFMDIYVAALYLPEKSVNGAAVLADGGEKRLALHFLRDIGADHLTSSLNKAIAANQTPAEMTALDAALKEFSALFNGMDEMKKGDSITLDYLPGNGTQVSINGIAKGKIADAAFYGALLKIWLGDKPVQKDLKQKLLGG